jgi:hypothetical protein
MPARPGEDDLIARYFAPLAMRVSRGLAQAQRARATRLRAAIGFIRRSPFVANLDETLRFRRGERAVLAQRLSPAGSRASLNLGKAKFPLASRRPRSTRCRTRATTASSSPSVGATPQSCIVIAAIFATFRHSLRACDIIIVSRSFIPRALPLDSGRTENTVYASLPRRRLPCKSAPRAPGRRLHIRRRIPKRLPRVPAEEP